MKKLDTQLKSLHQNREEMYKEVMVEEEFQRQAFQTLLINRDIQHKRLTETVSWCQG